MLGLGLGVGGKDLEIYHVHFCLWESLEIFFLLVYITSHFLRMRLCSLFIPIPMTGMYQLSRLICDFLQLFIDHD